MKEQQKDEMKRILNEQIAEKNKRKAEEKKQQEEEDLKFERSLIEFQPPASPSPVYKGFSRTLKTIHELDIKSQPEVKRSLEIKNEIIIEEPINEENLDDNKKKPSNDEGIEALKSQIQV